VLNPYGPIFRRVTNSGNLCCYLEYSEAKHVTIISPSKRCTCSGLIRPVSINSSYISILQPCFHTTNTHFFDSHWDLRYEVTIHVRSSTLLSVHTPKRRTKLCHMSGPEIRSCHKRWCQRGSPCNQGNDFDVPTAGGRTSLSV
jgi:hypothetical protein